MSKCVTKRCRHKTHGCNRHCSKCMMREWRAKNPIKAAYKQLQHRAKRRGKEFNLTYEEFEKWIYQHNLVDAQRGNEKHCISVDRIDHTRGYSIDNIQPLTVSENSCKWHYHDKRMAA